jgi:phenylalanyl-tRNA synthetase beta chain
MVLRASHRATELIREIASGTPAKEIGAAGKVPANPADVSLSYEKCDRVVGVTIKPKAVDGILERFGLKKSASAKATSKWKIPSYRRDLQCDVDLIEEIVRAYGVDKVPGTDRSRSTPSSAADHSHDLESALRERLAAFGLSEVRTSKLISRKATAFESAIALKNPLSEDHIALRPSLYPALLEVLVRNVRGGAERVAIFELGRVFIPPEGKEERHLGLLLCGSATSAPHWRLREKHQLDFFDLKGAIESLMIPELSFQRGEHPNFMLYTRAGSRNQDIGFIAQFSSERTSMIGAAGAVLFAELNVDLVLSAQESAKTFREIERFPAITRDIAMIVPEKISHAEILRVIQEPKEPLLESVELFDLFAGEGAAGLGPERKSLAYRLTYRDRSRTLTSEEVSAVHAKIRERLRRDLGAELRE